MRQIFGESFSDVAPNYVYAVFKRKCVNCLGQLRISIFFVQVVHVCARAFDFIRAHLWENRLERIETDYLTCGVRPINLQKMCELERAYALERAAIDNVAWHVFHCSHHFCASENLLKPMCIASVMKLIEDAPHFRIAI